MTKGYLCVDCGSQVVGHSELECVKGALQAEKLRVDMLSAGWKETARQLEEAQRELANAQNEIERLRCEEIPLLVTEHTNRNESLLKALLFEWRENHVRVCGGELLDFGGSPLLPVCARGANCEWDLPEVLL